MKKWLKRILFTLVFLVLLIVAVSLFLLGTETGTRWLVDGAESVTDNALQVAELRGDLLGDLDMQRISFDTAEIHIGIESLTLSWSPGELFGRVFHLKDLSISGLQIEQLQASASPKEEQVTPLVIDDIRLPIDIVIDRFQVTQATLITAPEAEPLLIDKVLLQAGWNSDGIALTTLQLVSPELNFSGDGNLNPVGSYPLDFSTLINVLGKDLPAVNVKGKFSGDLAKLDITQQLEGDIAGSLKVQVLDLAANLNWNIDLGITRLPKTLLPVSAQQGLVINVLGKGDVSQANAEVTVTTGASDGSDLALNADVQFETLAFNVEGAWKQLQWPLVGIPLIAAVDGKLQASGTPDDYQLNMDTGTAGQDVPEGKWTVVATGNSKSLEIKKLHGELLDGSVDVTAEVSWLPEVTWKATVATHAINPGVLDADWPGDINLTAVTNGNIVNEQLQGQLQLKQFSGNLRERVLAGSGTVHVDGSDLHIEDFNLHSGEASVSIDGDIKESLNVTWQLRVPDMADLLPDATGSIEGNGKLTGTTELPVIDGAISAAAIVFGSTDLESASIDFSMSMNTAHPSSLVVQTKNLDIEGERIDSIELNLDGPINAHRIQFAIMHEQLTLEFAAQGGYVEEQAVWQGDVRQFDILSSTYGEWRLKEKAFLTLAAEQVKLSPLCLQHAAAEFCSEADWLENTGTADIKLQNFDLEWIKPLLPPELVQLDGKLSFDLQLQNHDQLDALLVVDVQPGVLVVQADPDHQVRLDHKQGHINAKFDAQVLEVDWNLDLGEHNAQGELSIPRTELETDVLTAPLAGNIKLAVHDLDLVKAFVPQIEEISGDVDVDITLGGVLGKPRLNGHARLKSERITIPMVGLDMSAVLVNVSSDGSDLLNLTGTVTSGEGTLKLDGSISLDAEQQWPVSLNIKADRFQAANVPEAQLIFTTDISLQRKNGLNIVRGSLSIPEANIEVKEIPEGSQAASADVIIVSEDGEEQELPTENLDLELTLALGDKVHFGGLGLKADLGGKLTAIILPGRLPTANGEIVVKKGSFRAYGQDLTIEKGRISYAGGYLNNPGVQLRASRTIDNTKVGVDVSGTAKKLELNAFSDDPDISSSDAVSMLLTGQKLSDVSNAQIYAGKQITPDLSVGVNFGAGSSATEFVARYRIRGNIQAEGTSSSEKSGASILYTIDVE